MATQGEDMTFPHSYKNCLKVNCAHQLPSLPPLRKSALGDFIMSILIPVTLVGGTVWALWLAFRAYLLKSPLDNVPGPTRTSLTQGMCDLTVQNSTGFIFHQETWVICSIATVGTTTIASPRSTPESQNTTVHLAYVSQSLILMATLQL